MARRPTQSRSAVGAHVDQLDARIGLQQRERFLRRDGAGIGLAGAARAGGGEDLVGCAHAVSCGLHRHGSRCGGLAQMVQRASTWCILRTIALSWCVWHELCIKAVRT